MSVRQSVCKYITDLRSTNQTILNFNANILKKTKIFFSYDEKQNIPNVNCFFFFIIENYVDH